MVTQPIPRLFLHFFDTHFVEEVAGHLPAAAIEQEADLALRLAILAADEVFVPCASYFESDMCRRVLAPWAPLFGQGVIRLTGSAATAAEFTAAKLMRYPQGSRQGRRYEHALTGRSAIPPYRARSRSATEDLIRRWGSLPHTPDFEQNLIRGLTVQLPLDLPETWLAVPENLGGQPFTPELVMPVLFPQAMPTPVTMRVTRLINAGYFDSFCVDLDAGVVSDMVYLDIGARPAAPGVDLPFKAIVDDLRSSGLLSKIAAATPAQLLAMRGSADFAAAIVTRVGAGRTRAVQQPLYVPRPAELEAQVAKVLATSTGGGSASTSYQKRATALLDMIFQGQLQPGMFEFEINDGRKRIDVSFPNVAQEGFFAWVAHNWGAQFVYAEMKNYSKDDPENKELDQLIARFSDKYRVRFGLMLCRKVTKWKVLLRRCGDAMRSQQGVVLPITDDDLKALVAAAAVGGLSEANRWMYNRYVEVRDS